MRDRLHAYRRVERLVLLGPVFMVRAGDRMDDAQVRTVLELDAGVGASPQRLVHLLPRHNDAVIDGAHVPVFCVELLGCHEVRQPHVAELAVDFRTEGDEAVESTAVVAPHPQAHHEQHDPPHHQRDAEPQARDTKRGGVRLLEPLEVQHIPLAGQAVKHVERQRAEENPHAAERPPPSEPQMPRTPLRCARRT